MKYLIKFNEYLNPDPVGSYIDFTAKSDDESRKKHLKMLGISNGVYTHTTKKPNKGITNTIPIKRKVYKWETKPKKAKTRAKIVEETPIFEKLDDRSVCVELSDYLQEIFDKYDIKEVKPGAWNKEEINYSNWCILQQQVGNPQIGTRIAYTIYTKIKDDVYENFIKDIENSKRNIEKRLGGIVHINCIEPNRYGDGGTLYPMGTVMIRVIKPLPLPNSPY